MFGRLKNWLLRPRRNASIPVKLDSSQVNELTQHCSALLTSLTSNENIRSSMDTFPVEERKTSLTLFACFVTYLVRGLLTRRIGGASADEVAESMIKTFSDRYAYDMTKIVLIWNEVIGAMPDALVAKGKYFKTPMPWADMTLRLEVAGFELSQSTDPYLHDTIARLCQFLPDSMDQILKTVNH